MNVPDRKRLRPYWTVGPDVNLRGIADQERVLRQCPRREPRRALPTILGALLDLTLLPQAKHLALGPQQPPCSLVVEFSPTAAEFPRQEFSFPGEAILQADEQRLVAPIPQRLENEPPPGAVP